MVEKRALLKNNRIQRLSCKEYISECCGFVRYEEQRAIGQVTPPPTVNSVGRQIEMLNHHRLKRLIL
jgi:hypothetical protein